MSFESWIFSSSSSLKWIKPDKLWIRNPLKRSILKKPLIVEHISTTWGRFFRGNQRGRSVLILFLFLRGAGAMKPNLQVNLGACLHRPRTHVWLDLCLLLFDNTSSETKSPDAVFLWNLMYNNNSSVIISLDSRSGHKGRVKIKWNIGIEPCPWRYGALRPLRGGWVTEESRLNCTW